MQNRMNPTVTQQQMDKQENLELRFNEYRLIYYVDRGSF